ncbi:hypothetical protein OE88DRAFT_1739904 [Heliocybe sulcata]|uniref:DUF6533 domain-containing protein n=1 Tax=Heliocybe sulcata TaxID=5364 RepID=A0A5C3MMJ4_9AGAM|nr:hypothetical protein OE88DRAFT_1739904 [Heliocybe sulcata]
MEANLQEFMTVLSHLQIERYSAVAGLAFYAYHFIQTMPTEVELIWGTPLSIMKVLYMLNRYYGIVAIVPTVYCNLWSEWGSWAGLVLTQLIESEFDAHFYPSASPHCAVILQIRLHAILEHKKLPMVVVSVLYVCEVITMLVMGIIRCRTVNSGVIDVYGFKSCSGTTPTYFYAWWIPIMVFDAMLMLLIMYKAASHMRSQAKSQLPKEWGYASRLLFILAKDSVVYYVVIFCVWMGNTLLWELGSVDLWGVGSTWAMVIPSTAATSIMLNLRAESKRSTWSAFSTSSFAREAPESFAMPNRQTASSLRFTHSEMGEGTSGYP